MALKRWTFEEWKAYQMSEMARLAERCASLQGQVWELKAFFEDHSEAHGSVSRETNSPDYTYEERHGHPQIF